MRFPDFAAATLIGLLSFNLPALASPTPDAPLTAANLLNDCVSAANTGTHAVCLVVVGSIMDGVDIATIAARKNNLKPAICIPPDLDRQTVVERFIYAMGSGNGAYNDEKAAMVVGAMLMTFYPCK